MRWPWARGRELFRTTTIPLKRGDLYTSPFDGTTYRITKTRPLSDQYGTVVIYGFEVR